VGVPRPLRPRCPTMSIPLTPRDPMSQTARNALISGGVVLLHVAALWALQAGLLRRAAEIIVPVELISALLSPPAAPAPSVPQPAAAEPAPQPIPHRTQPAPARAPRPVAAADPSPAAAAPSATSEPQPPAPALTTPMTASPAPAPAPAARVEMPITDADYLQNPPPAYPRMSFRLGEEGTTTVRVLIGPDGRAQDAQIAKSSGYARLDLAAEATARSWRYVPGKRGGVPEAMWVNVPIKWEIKKN
jgi:periplasmic protein TonB